MVESIIQTIMQILLNQSHDKGIWWTIFALMSIILLTIGGFGTLDIKKIHVSKSVRQIAFVSGLVLFIPCVLVLFLPLVPSYNSACCESVLGKLVEQNLWHVERLKNGVDHENEQFEIVQDPTNTTIKVIRVNPELTSQQDKSGYTSPLQSLLFAWNAPLRDKPYAGIIAQLYVSPDAGYQDAKIFCRFVVQYDIR